MSFMYTGLPISKRIRRYFYSQNFDIFIRSAKRGYRIKRNVRQLIFEDAVHEAMISFDFLHRKQFLLWRKCFRYAMKKITIKNPSFSSEQIDLR